MLLLIVEALKSNRGKIFHHLLTYDHQFSPHLLDDVLLRGVVHSKIITSISTIPSVIYQEHL